MSEQTKNEKTSCCRPLAAAPVASPTPDGAAPSATVPSVPEVPSVLSNVGEHETLPEIEEDLRSDKRRFSNSDATAIASRIQEARKRQEQAHQKELDALNEQIADLRRQRECATAEKSSVVGDCAKLRRVCEQMLELLKDPPGFNDGGMSVELDEEQVVMWRDRFLDALAAPPRNCDRPECKDIQSAMNVYRRECCEDGPLYARKEGAMHEAEWLLAPATEKEGGSK